MRNHLRLLILGIVVVALGGVGTLVGRTLWRQYRATLLQKGIEMLPGVAQRLQNFRRVKVIDDRKVWEVAAEDAQYYEAEKMILVARVSVQLFLEDGRTIGLEGREGRIYLDGKEISRVELNGGIHASMADYKVDAENAIYDHDTNSISVPGAVRISGTGIDLRGNGMEIDVETKTLRLLQKVAMNVVPVRLGAGGGDHAPL